MCKQYYRAVGILPQYSEGIQPKYATVSKRRVYNPEDFQVRINTGMDEIQQLVRALEADNYNTSPAPLVQGQPLVVEDLDLSGWTHYVGNIGNLKHYNYITNDEARKTFLGEIMEKETFKQNIEVTSKYDLLTPLLDTPTEIDLAQEIQSATSFYKENGRKVFLLCFGANSDIGEERAVELFSKSLNLLSRENLIKGAPPKNVFVTAKGLNPTSAASYICCVYIPVDKRFTVDRLLLDNGISIENIAYA